MNKYISTKVAFLSNLFITAIPEISIFYLVFSRIMIMWELVSESFDRGIKVLWGEGSCTNFWIYLVFTRIIIIYWKCIDFRFYLVFSRIMIMWELVSESLDREIQMLGGEGSWRPGERGWRQWWQLVDQGQPQRIQAYRTIVDLKSKFFCPFLTMSLVGVGFDSNTILEQNAWALVKYLCQIHTSG